METQQFDSSKIGISVFLLFKLQLLGILFLFLFFIFWRFFLFLFCESVLFVVFLVVA
jgi:hypothetical protein